MPAEFKILNITRRRKLCLGCNTIFYTVEISEGEYRRLIHRQLTSSAPRVRPSHA